MKTHPLRQRRWIMGVVAIVAVALSGALASAHTAVFNNAVHADLARPFQAGTAEYLGVVFAKKDRCQPRRLVKLFHDSNPDFKIGQDRTNREGDWRIVGPLPPSGDEVYVRVKVKFLDKDEFVEHNHRCRPDRSRNYDINELLNP